MKGRLQAHQWPVLVIAILLVVLIQAKGLAGSLIFNVVAARVQQYDPSLVWGLGYFDSYQSSALAYNEFGSELPNPNWPQAPSRTAYLGLLSSVLHWSPSTGDNWRWLHLMARLQAYAGLPQLAWDTIETVMGDSRCTDLSSHDTACIIVWTDAGDVLDELGRGSEALAYYRATGWFRRREAGTELLLQLADKTEDSSVRESALEEARTLSPDALVVQFQELSSQPESVLSLRAPGDPRLAMPVYRDPRLERRQAEAVAWLVTHDIWNQHTLARVLQFRAWQMDMYSMTYRNFQVVKEWTPQQNTDPSRVKALLTFFDHMAALLPASAIAQQARAEAYERAGNLLTNHQAYAASTQTDMPSVTTIEQPIASTDFRYWWSYGQAYDVTSLPSTEFGYDDAPVGWAWGPDTLHTFEAQPSFRAGCIWTQTIADKRMAVLYATWVGHEGAALPFSVPAGSSMVVDYWWQALGDIRIAYRGPEPVAQQDMAVEGQWVHSAWVFSSAARARTVLVSWEYGGCGTFWLGRLTAKMTPGATP